MTTSESNGRFFDKTNRFESIRITNRIDWNRELECSSVCTSTHVDDLADLPINLGDVSVFNQPLVFTSVIDINILW